MADLSELFDDETVTELENWTPSDKNLSTIGDTANRMLSAQRGVSYAEAQLVTAKAQLKQVQEEDLPALMAEAGLSEIRLATGEKLTIDRYYGASIPAGDREDAFEWLRDNGHGDIIKHTVGINFKKGEGREADRAQDLLRSAGFEATNEEKIAPPTLKAFVRVEVEEGRTLPPSFNVFVGQRAKIKK